MMNIPFLRPHLVTQEDLFPYLREIDASRQYSNFGPLNARLEKEILDDYFDGDGAVTTVSNATIGLILALSRCRRPHGKYVLMPSFTFSATPLSALWCGLEPYFVDVNKDDWCMDTEMVGELLSTLGDQVAAVMPYATFGTNLDLTYYASLHDSGIPVIVDAAASFGVNGQYGHFGKGFPGTVVFSFHATKSFGVGEGGLIYSRDEGSISDIRQTENFGFTTGRETAFKGLNGKMSEYHAAIGLATLQAYPRKIGERQKVYQWYVEALKDKRLLSQGWELQAAKGRIPYQFMPVLCPPEKKNHEIIEVLNQDQIEARTYFSPPCHQHPLFSNHKRTTMRYTDHISRRIVSLPLWEEMTEPFVERIVTRMACS
ncbi:aminotransferase class I/II-fold pyridoxal phosphate-dependent enzyme [Rossellomorea sp. NPDC077527]|uniref:aminotransferase class I/II-fold pyridoxal phosphate-dependent enzyme n=1 Tax=Rossellomorea sp. NPDC077527 TaxID=3364510 RepID=UPI0037CA0143